VQKLKSTRNYVSHEQAFFKNCLGLLHQNHENYYENQRVGPASDPLGAAISRAFGVQPRGWCSYFDIWLNPEGGFLLE
jgi:hypothetical protein